MYYFSNTDEDRKEMLKVIGVENVEELWKQAGVTQHHPHFQLPMGLSEYETRRYLTNLANQNAHQLHCFLGLGYYDHFIPAVVDDIIRRTEFLTAYTPYQPEASQGTLQAIYEYQSLICRLTDMDASNASMYDGGTALFEAIMMAIRASKNRRKVILADTISPIYYEMIRCYCQNLSIELITVPHSSAETTYTNLDYLRTVIDDRTSALVLQYPNVFGTIEDYRDIVEYAHQYKVFCIASCYPMALSLIESPGRMGFDIVCGEAQCFGIPLSFGGPYLGYLACKKDLIRQMPGRIVGRTTELNSEKTAFVLTLQAREQHIRREKATSNICSNEGLCAIAAAVYLSSVGKNGFIKLGNLCHSKAHYTRDLLLQIEGISIPQQETFFNEFVINLPIDAGELVYKMIKKGFAAGFPLGRYYPNRKHQLLVAVTEKRTREEIQSFAVAMEACLATIY